MERVLSLVSFDFLSPDCFFKKSSEYKTVLLWTFLPLALAFANLLAYLLRGPGITWWLAWRRGGGDRSEVTEAAQRRRVFQQHMFVFLMGSYLVLPSVARSQLQALDCVQLQRGELYLRTDTAVKCTSATFRTFRTLDAAFICVYLSIPAVWLLLLWKQRMRLKSNEADTELAPYTFLFQVYRSQCYFFECVEIYRLVFS